jgi:hypothetical protein
MTQDLGNGVNASKRNVFSLKAWSGNTAEHLELVKYKHQRDIDANPNASWVPLRREYIAEIDAELESRKASK